MDSMGIRGDVISDVYIAVSSELEAKGHPDFSREEAFRILENIAGYAKPVVFIGGEPS